MQSCPKCALENPDSYRFCAGCHALLRSGNSNANPSSALTPSSAMNDLPSGPDNAPIRGWLRPLLLALILVFFIYAIALQRVHRREEVSSGPTRPAKVDNVMTPEPPAALPPTPERAAPVTSPAPGAEAADSEVNVPLDAPGARPAATAASAAKYGSGTYNNVIRPPAPAAGYAGAVRRYTSVPAGMEEESAPAAEPRIADAGQTERQPVSSSEDPVDYRPRNTAGEISAPVIIARRQRSSASAGKSAPIRVEKGQLEYQEQIADDYLRLGQKKEAARVLEKLLSLNLAAADRERLTEKLKACGVK